MTLQRRKRSWVGSDPDLENLASYHMYSLGDFLNTKYTKIQMYVPLILLVFKLLILLVFILLIIFKLIYTSYNASLTLSLRIF
jgi:hypothetical protein